MSPGYYHTPPPPVSTRVRCPVCHEQVYSRAGIHPQCAVKQSDPPKPKKQAAVVTDPVAVVVVVAAQVADQGPPVLPEAPILEITFPPNAAAG